jgi:predicted O-linked N-acetylglucosamine transferase (SPINDLY family)
MAGVTVDDTLEAALRSYQSGRFDEAEGLCGEALAQSPNHPAALRLLGMVALQIGRLDAAVELSSGAIAIYNAMGVSLNEKGRVDDAAAAWQRALEIRPDYIRATSQLAADLQAGGRHSEALAIYARAQTVTDEQARLANVLGLARITQRRLDDAIAAFTQSIQLKPEHAESHNNLAVALKNRGRLDEAIAACKEAIRLKPDFAPAYNNLGSALFDKGEFDGAISAYRQAIELNPRYAKANSNLGAVFQRSDQLDEAIAASSQAIQLDPDLVEAHNNLGNLLRDSGRCDEAIASYRRAITIKPDFVEAHSNLLYALHFHPDCDAAALYAEHRRWNLQHAAPLKASILPHDNDRQPHRRLRIGYVSQDFRNHPVGRFVLPLLSAHDRQDFEVYCYSDAGSSDSWTEKLRHHADVWRDVFGLSHEQLANIIHRDAIDILVDLALHAAGSRLLVFARKPAPVQLTYLAYCSTSGLDTIDYRISDSHLDPPGSGDEHYSERTVCIPTYWCYQPAIESAEPAQPPIAIPYRVTFGSLNHFSKISGPTLAAWCRILQSVPESCFMLHAPRGGHRDRLRDSLKQEGIDPKRLTFVDRVPMQDYLEQYRRIDIGLDPFPYGGGTTTCDALWMGVPVVSLSGRTAVGRGGASILFNTGLSDLVARSAEEYIEIAARLAADPLRLGELRSNLRQRMRGSPLMDTRKFAESMEAAYRETWERWCRSGSLPETRGRAQ